jgi:glycosyltransferase involved in cell wall biosynthesis
MKTVSVSMIYMTRPDSRYGIGGVRRFLTLFSEFASSKKEFKCEYYTIFDRPPRPRRLNPILNLLFAFRLLIRLIISSQDKHERRVLYTHDAGYSGLVAATFGRIRHLPLILHYHNSPSASYLASTSLRSPVGKVGYSVIRRMELLVLASSDHIIVTNTLLRRTVTNLGIPADKITVLPMSLRVETFYTDRKTSKRVRNELGIPANAYLVGYVGRLSPEKNLDTLINAFSSLVNSTKRADSRLLLVGDGSEKENLKNRILSLKTDNYVVFTGFRYDVPRLLNAFDVFVLPSKTEGSPIALLEAMASGKAIIASNIPAICEVVRNGKEAILFAPNDVERLKEALLKLHDDSSLRRMLGANAKKKAKQYDVNIILQKVLKVLESSAYAHSNP